MEAARVLFLVGAGTLIAAGAAHALLTLWDDVVRPRFFTPIDDRVRPVTDRTGIRFRALFPGPPDRPSMWRAWRGFNISHGLGLAALGLVLLLLAASDFERVTETSALLPVTLGASAIYLALALRYWFWGPVLVISVAITCFAVAWALTL